MTFLFIQKNAFPLEGVMSLAAVIKNIGWQAEVALAGEEDIFQALKKYQPKIVGFPVFTGEHHWVLNLAREIKKKHPGIFILLGGPHPTYYPEIIYKRGVDGIIRGEGEGAVVDFLEGYIKGGSINKIKNLWVKKGKKVYKNPLRPLIEPLDILPIPDREIYYRYGFLKNASVKQFLTTRGCPFNCTFCSNHLLKKLYRNKGKFVRRYSPKRVLKEMRGVKEKYGFQTISFTDDVFVYDRVWLKRFLPKYQKEIGAPFICNITASVLDDSLARLLKKGGCYGLAMGVESGVEMIRIDVMKKIITNKQIKESAKIAHKYNLALKTYNILSLPGESLEDALATIKLNAEIKPTSAAASLLQPYPGYEITKYAIQHNFLPKSYGTEDVEESIYLSSPIKGRDYQRIENLQALFPLLAAHPWLIPFVKPFLNIQSKTLFRFLARLTYGYYTSKVHRLSFKDKVRYLRHLDPLKV